MDGCVESWKSLWFVNNWTNSCDVAVCVEITDDCVESLVAAFAMVRRYDPFSLVFSPLLHFSFTQKHAFIQLGFCAPLF